MRLSLDFIPTQSQGEHGPLEYLRGYKLLEINKKDVNAHVKSHEHPSELKNVFSGAHRGARVFTAEV
jgi:hypothetical protein